MFTVQGKKCKSKLMMANVDFLVVRGVKEAEMLGETSIFWTKILPYSAFKYLQCTLQSCLQFKVKSVNRN